MPTTTVTRSSQRDWLFDGCPLATPCPTADRPTTDRHKALHFHQRYGPDTVESVARREFAVSFKDFLTRVYDPSAEPPTPLPFDLRDTGSRSMRDGAVAMVRYAVLRHGETWGYIVVTGSTPQEFSANRTALFEEARRRIVAEEAERAQALSITEGR